MHNDTLAFSENSSFSNHFGISASQNDKTSAQFGKHKTEFDKT